MKSEESMYQPIAGFLRNQKKCRYVQINRTRFTYVKNWTIDVVGLSNVNVYGVEAKKSFTFDSVSAAVQQGTFYKRACTHVYLSFPAEAYASGKEEIRRFLHRTSIEKGFGLLLVQENGTVKEERPIPRSFEMDIDFNLYHDVVTQLTSDTPSDEIQGGRAFIVRDICYLIDQSRIESEAVLEERFIVMVPQNNVDYWKGQGEHRINPRAKPMSTLVASIRAATELGIIGISDNGLENTLLGEILCSTADDEWAWKVHMSSQTKWAFYLIALRYPEVRSLLSILSSSDKRLRWASDICEFCGARGGYVLGVEGATLSCHKCNREVDQSSENVSVRTRVQLEVGFDAYNQLAFWINSKVLPVRTISNNQFICYDPSALIQ